MTNQLTCFEDFADVTPAYEDVNSKLLNVASVADVDAGDCVNDSLVEIFLDFGHHIEAEGWS